MTKDKQTVILQTNRLLFHKQANIIIVISQADQQVVISQADDEATTTTNPTESHARIPSW